MKMQPLGRLGVSSLAVLLPFALLTGCGSGEKSDVPSAGGKKPSAGSTAEKPGAGDPDAGVLKFVRCLRENDIEVDDPETNGNVSIQVTDTQDQAKISKAQNACKQYMDAGGSGGGAAGGGKETEEQKVWRLKVERCLRDKGFKIGNVAEDERAAHEKASKECYKEAGPVPGAGQ
ncbi:hypothetical protein [Streptomyces chryseus]|uniref:hypothetical protein n=1 Tax=Streptomyces chryseus TaxID=68186 RepID=UPI00110FB323|nr:hypothetical protein [Streptomyces chryseus]